MRESGSNTQVFTCWCQAFAIGIIVKQARSCFLTGWRTTAAGELTAVMHSHCSAPSAAAIVVVPQLVWMQRQQLISLRQPLPAVCTA
jgi:hypothetical protein